MSQSDDPRAAARSRAQMHFEAAEHRDATVFAEIAKERSAAESKTARLKALRLAREEEQRAADARAAAQNPPPKTKRTRKSSARKPRRVSVPA